MLQRNDVIDVNKLTGSRAFENGWRQSTPHFLEIGHVVKNSHVLGCLIGRQNLLLSELRGITRRH